MLSPPQLAREFGNAVNMIFSSDACFDSGTGELHYAAVAASREFDALINGLGALHWINLKQLSRDHLMAFCINVYNCLLIHASLHFNAPGQVSAVAIVPDASSLQAAYEIGDEKYTLHGNHCWA